MAQRWQFGECSAATPSAAVALTRFRALTRGLLPHRSAQMTPAIYHKKDRSIDRNSLWQKYVILISRVAVGRTHALFSSSPSSLFLHSSGCSILRQRRRRNRRLRPRWLRLLHPRRRRLLLRPQLRWLR